MTWASKSESKTESSVAGAVIVQKTPDPSKSVLISGLSTANRVETNTEPSCHKYTLAIDPGGTTGVAIRLPDGTLTTFTIDVETDLWDLFDDSLYPRPQCVVLEQWQYFKGIATPAGTYTAGLVDSLRGICYVLRIPIRLHTPQSRKGYQKAAKAWLDEHKPLHVVHEEDALAHLFKWESMDATYDK